MNYTEKIMTGKKVLLAVVVSTFLFLLVACLGIGVISQTDKNVDNRSENESNFQDYDKETKRLVDILEKREKTGEVLIDTIQKLKSISDKRTIPIIIKYLDYDRYSDYRNKTELSQKQSPELKIDPIEETHWNDKAKLISWRYPATEVLIKIGKPSLPALVKVIEDDDTESIKTQNALYTIQQIFRDDLSEAVKYLEGAKISSATQEGKQRLSDAAENTKTKCRILEECRIKLINAEQDANTSSHRRN
ncbi:MAG TPA: hypothetical protein VF648_08715 [Pyrinomonadaceae bacterium]